MCRRKAVGENSARRRGKSTPPASAPPLLSAVLAGSAAGALAVRAERLKFP